MLGCTLEGNQLRHCAAKPIVQLAIITNTGGFLRQLRSRDQPSTGRMHYPLSHWGSNDYIDLWTAYLRTTKLLPIRQMFSISVSLQHPSTFKILKSTFSNTSSKVNNADRLLGHLPAYSHINEIVVFLVYSRNTPINSSLAECSYLANYSCGIIALMRWMRHQLNKCGKSFHQSHAFISHWCDFRTLSNKIVCKRRLRLSAWNN